MSRMGRKGEILLMVCLFGVAPILFTWAVPFRSRARMERLKARQQEMERQLAQLPSVQPLTREERALLEDPQARWRRRIPTVAGDAARLAQYARVVTELEAAWKGAGISTSSLRSAWDPVKASHTLPPHQALQPPPLTEPQLGGAGRPEAWVLEAGIQGDLARLRQAYILLPGIDPILEPVGLRWESSPDGLKQAVILRNIVLVP